MRETISTRARELFALARAKTADGVRRIKAEHASSGRLGSGSTIKRVVEMHCVMSRDALKTAIDYVGRRVESRGFHWRRMIADVHRELDAHLTAAEQSLKDDLAKIMTDGPKLAETLLVEVHKQLRRELEDYREGWTGPPGKPWTERHKVLYTILVALGGAVAGKLVEFAFALGG